MPLNIAHLTGFIYLAKIWTKPVAN